MSFAQMALNGQVAVAPVSNKRIAGLETRRVIFFAGDAIPPHEKYEMPEVKGFGGIYLPHIRTLPQGANHGSRGMVYRCKFTPLTTKMKAEPKTMLPPAAREHWETEFIQTITVEGEKVERTVSGFLESNPRATQKKRFEQEESDHLVFKKRYPGQDIVMATRRSLPNGIGGVVDVEGLVGASDREIEEAQYFFFPNWDDIEQGLEDLPEQTSELERHIRTRLATIDKEDYSSFATRMRLIGRDMLKSCTEFRRTGNQIVQTDEKAFKAAAKDDTQGFSAISTHLLPQLNVTRKEDVITGGNEAINRLANVMEKNAAPAVPAGMSDEDMLEFLTWKLQRKAEGKSLSIPVEAKEEVPQVVDTDGDGSPDFGDSEERHVEQFAPAEPPVFTGTNGAPVELHPLNKGAEVILDGKKGTVIGKPFGKYTIAFEDGSDSQTVSREELS